MTISQYIGNEITYDPQPYGVRKVRITSIRPTGHDRTIYSAEGISYAPTYRVEGIVTEGKEISRLFHHVSSRDIAGEHVTIYSVTEMDLARGHIWTATCG
jgi:hypothetical protein